MNNHIWDSAKKYIHSTRYRQDKIQTGQDTDRTRFRQDKIQTGQDTDRTRYRQDKIQTEQDTDRTRYSSFHTLTLEAQN
jgi:hypothetical protein